MGWFIAALLALAVAATALCAVRLRAAGRELARCREWAIVTGTVVECSIRDVRDEGAGTQYVPVVAYRYIVDGRQ